MTSRRPLPIICTMFTLGTALLGGCDRGDSIQTYQVSKSLPIAAQSDAADSPPEALPVHWNAPAGWKALPGNEMRAASFEVSPQHPEVEMSVVPLGGAGGSLLANVVRWENQLGLPPSSENDVARLAAPIDLSGVPATRVTLDGPPRADGKPIQRTVAVIVPRGDRTWFFKLSGQKEVVQDQQAKFDQFVQSLRFDPVAPPQSDTTPLPNPNPPPSSDAAVSQPPINFDPPAGWTDEKKSNQFRVASFQLQEGNQSAEIVVSTTPKDAGTVLDNVNRWRGQVALEPLSDLSQLPAASLKIGGEPATLWDLRPGPGTAAGAQRMLVAMATHDQQWWFFKLIGPSGMIETHRDAFMNFLASVKFAGDAQ